MPMGDLRVETIVGDQKVDGNENVHQITYFTNGHEKATDDGLINHEVEPQPEKRQCRSRRRRSRDKQDKQKTTDIQGLQEALDRDLRKPNIPTQYK